MKLITSEMLKVHNEVENTPIEQLRDLWTIRYGNEWVDDTDMDLFYAATTIRLYYADMLDKTTPPTNWNAKYRLKKD